jgi:hypothetical protein
MHKLSLSATAMSAVLLTSLMPTTGIAQQADTPHYNVRQKQLDLSLLKSICCQLNQNLWKKNQKRQKKK